MFLEIDRGKKEPKISKIQKTDDRIMKTKMTEGNRFIG